MMNIDDFDPIVKGKYDTIDIERKYGVNGRLYDGDELIQRDIYYSDLVAIIDYYLIDFQPILSEDAFYETELRQLSYYLNINIENDELEIELEEVGLTYGDYYYRLNPYSKNVVRQNKIDQLI